jgi:hypothetical protein
LLLLSSVQFINSPHSLLQSCPHFSYQKKKKKPCTQASAASAKKSPRCTWHPEIEEAFLLLLDTLLDAQTQGLQTDNGSFKPAGWNMAFEAVIWYNVYTFLSLLLRFGAGFGDKRVLPIP